MHPARRMGLELVTRAAVALGTGQGLVVPCRDGSQPFGISWLGRWWPNRMVLAGIAHPDHDHERLLGPRTPIRFHDHGRVARDKELEQRGGTGMQDFLEFFPSAGELKG
jgi:hypothetical protein